MALALGVAVRGERVALLSVIGSVVCVGGAWLMRRAQNSREEQGSNHSQGRQPVLKAIEQVQPNFNNADEHNGLVNAMRGE